VYAVQFLGLSSLFFQEVCAICDVYCLLLMATKFDTVCAARGME